MQQPTKDAWRPPVGIEYRLRLYCVHQWFILSDSAVEKVPDGSNFIHPSVGIDPARELLPQFEVAEKREEGNS